MRDMLVRRNKDSMREARKFGRCQEQTRELERRPESIVLDVRDVFEVLSAEDSVDLIAEVSDSRL